MRDAVETITELPLATVLGSEFDAAENQAWLAAWAERWMALAPTAALGWWSDGTELIEGTLLWEGATSGWTLARLPNGDHQWISRLGHTYLTAEKPP